MSHSSMLKARRQNQKTKKLLALESKQAKRLAKQALAGPVAKREKVKKEKVKKVKPIKEEAGKPESKKSGKDAAKKDTAKKDAS